MAKSKIHAYYTNKQVIATEWYKCLRKHQVTESSRREKERRPLGKKCLSQEQTALARRRVLGKQKNVPDLGN